MQLRGSPAEIECKEKVNRKIQMEKKRKLRLCIVLKFPCPLETQSTTRMIDPPYPLGESLQQLHDRGILNVPLLFLYL
jgi:hypothetical protein